MREETRGGIRKKRAKGIPRKSGNWGVEKSSPGERRKFNFQRADIQIAISKFKKLSERREKGREERRRRMRKGRRGEESGEPMSDETEMQSGRVVLCRWN